MKMENIVLTLTVSRISVVEYFPPLMLELGSLLNLETGHFKKSNLQVEPTGDISSVERGPPNSYIFDLQLLMARDCRNPCKPPFQRQSSSVVIDFEWIGEGGQG